MDETPEREPEREAPAELPQDVADRQRKRERLRAYLKENHSQYLDWYDGAVHVAGDLKNKDRFRQAAHSLRDLSVRVVHDLLPRDLVAKFKSDKTKGQSAENSFAIQIELAIAGVRDVAEIGAAVRAQVQALAKQWADVQDRLVSIAHSGTNDPDEVPRLIGEFEDVLWDAFQATPDRVAAIDGYLKIERPDAKALKELLRLVTQPAAQEYFFERLAHPGWLAPLLKAGAFARPPGAIRRDKTIQFPGWAALKYLERVASTSPESVVAIAQQLGGIDNPHVMGQVVALLMKLPVDQAAKAVPIVVQWLQQPFQLFVHYNAVKLYDHFVANKAWRSAAALMRGFTAIKDARRPGSSKLLSAEAKGFTDDYEYGDFLEKHLPPLIAVMPNDVFRCLEKRLAEALALEQKAEGKGGGRTSRWRPTIEDSRHNTRHEAVRDSLVTAIRDALAVLGKTDLAKFREALKRLSARRHWIFKRLRIDAVRVHRAAVPDIAARLLKNVPVEKSKRAYFELYHEYHKLVCEALGDMSAKDREKFLDHLAKKLKFKWRGKKKNDRPARDLQRFLLGAAAHLPKGTKYGDLLERMNTVLGPVGMDPSVFSEMSVGWVGPQSPVAQTDLGKMALGDIIALLKSFVGGPEFRAPTPEGLGRVLADAVKADPKKFLDGLGAFKDPDLKPLYLQHLLRGLHDALKEKKSIDWAAVLDLVADLSTRKTGQNPAIKDPEQDYESVYGDIARLLELGFDSDRANLTVAQAEAGLKVLLQILAQPVGAIERRYDEGDHDATAASINTFHGQTLHALVRYLMFRWSLLSPGGRLRPVAGVRELFSAEIQASLDKLLASKDATPAMHAALGWRYPLIKMIAPDWATANQDMIFKSADPKLWEGAWDGYISFNEVYDDLLAPLRKHYEKAIETMPERETSNRVDKESLNHLAQHLLIAKLFGLSFGDGPDLLMAFYEKAPLAQREHAAWFMGPRGLADDTKKPRFWNALKPVIEARIAWAEATKDLEIIGGEIGALAHALEFVPGPFAEIMDLLRRCFPFLKGGRYAEDVVRFLCTRAATEPLAALELLEEMFRTRLAHIELWGSEADLRATLQVARGSADQAVREKAAVIATLFFEAGHIEYRDLL